MSFASTSTIMFPPTQLGEDEWNALVAQAVGGWKSCLLFLIES